MKKVLVVGMGEVGNSMYALIEDSRKYKLFKKDTEEIDLNEEIDIMHICLPFADNFVQITEDYVKKYNPGLTIINSTVKPGTTDEIINKTNAQIVFSPVRGKHPHLKEDLLRLIKFIGGRNADAENMAKEHFESLGVKCEILSSPLEAELGKLLSTTYYAVNIAFHQEMERMCKKLGVDFKQAVTRFNATYTMDFEQKTPRPLMFPGVIRGHCLMENIEILKKDFDSEFLDAIKKSNEKKKEEK